MKGRRPRAAAETFAVSAEAPTPQQMKRSAISPSDNRGREVRITPGALPDRYAGSATASSASCTIA